MVGHLLHLPVFFSIFLFSFLFFFLFRSRELLGWIFLFSHHSTGLRQVADAHVAGLVTQQGLLELLHACLCSSGQEAPVQSLLWPLPIHLASVCDSLSHSVPSSDSVFLF
jgi:hypothetical protein